MNWIWILMLSASLLQTGQRVTAPYNHSVTVQTQEVQEGTGVGNNTNPGQPATP